jgi:hypothetical protein
MGLDCYGPIGLYSALSLPPLHIHDFLLIWVWLLDFNLHNVFKPSEISSMAFVGHLINALLQKESV